MSDNPPAVPENPPITIIPYDIPAFEFPEGAEKPETPATWLHVPGLDTTE